MKNVEVKTPSIIELGSAYGMVSRDLLRDYGGTATLVDYSPKAIEISRRLFGSLKAHFITGDVFAFNSGETHSSKYDIVHSQGLLEHYQGEKQDELFRIHVSLAKRGGFIIVFVPRPSIAYNCWNTVAQRLFGFEAPLTLERAESLFSKYGVKLVDEEKTFLEWGLLGTRT